jgi:hypothetical protein
VSADAGLARVLVSTDVPASVTHVGWIEGTAQRGSMHGTVTELVCERTPCALTLPYGDHELQFAAIDDRERSSTAVVHVRQSTVVVNHTLGRRHTPAGQGLGGALTILGIMTAIGAGVWGKNAQPGDSAAAIVAGSGLATSLLGVAVMGTYSTIEQPGATRSWSPPAPASTGAQLSLGVRF